ncbi:HD domain-containing phosphohydrolase [Candidatus Magnetomonas plexicatena]|uniref:HD domain-containing phosphohydrolase n=1 Tax=Candidatus Magnetomonas plexicatena TaxID=2552947 RepID=UPI001C742DC6|nr:response regulator [Nitrospirales bacterium LBB_01]
MDVKQIYEAAILIVDDQQTNVALAEKMLKAEGYKNILTTTDSRCVVDLYKFHKPDLILLDLNMPNMDGFQVMTELKKIESNTYLSIMVLTAYTDRTIRVKALEHGAKDFLTKPFDRLEVLTRIKNMLEIRLLHNEVIDYNKSLEEKVEERTRQLKRTQLEIIRRLGRASEYRDNETGNHIIRMSQFCEVVARRAGLSNDHSELILHASPMHDVGKIGIPDSVLLKPAKLDPDEFEIMKTHTTKGAEILDNHDSEIMNLARTIALTHHEKWDGSGYPNGVSGEAIPIEGRIVAICDVFDALTSKRPYKKAWTVDEAVAEIKKNSGTHFDANLVEVFIKHLDEILKIKESYEDV